MSWTADSIQITADQTWWTADGFNGCIERCGSGYPVNPVIIYETIPVETVKKVVKKVEAYKKEEKVVSPEAINAITESMVEAWSTDEMRKMMELYDISREVALLSYRETLKRLIMDEDLAFVLILASI